MGVDFTSLAELPFKVVLPTNLKFETWNLGVNGRGVASFEFNERNTLQYCKSSLSLGTISVIIVVQKLF